MFTIYTYYIFYVLHIFGGMCMMMMMMAVVVVVMVVVVVIICRACNTFCLIRCHIFIHAYGICLPHIYIWGLLFGVARTIILEELSAGYCVSSNAFKYVIFRTHTCFFLWKVSAAGKLAHENMGFICITTFLYIRTLYKSYRGIAHTK